MSVGTYQITMQFSGPVEVRGDAEYDFACWLHRQKYKSENASLKFDIVSSEFSRDDKLTEQSLRFEVSVIDAAGGNEKAYTNESAKEIIISSRRRTPDKSVQVKLWHWSSPVFLPPLDNERLEYPVIPLRIRQQAELTKQMDAITEKRDSKISQLDLLRGMLDAVLSLNLDFGEAQSEHEVRNIVLQALGRELPPVPQSWEFQVVIEFANGGDVVLVQDDRDRTNEILHQEVDRRRKLRLPLDCFLRRRRINDRLITYIHPPPSKGRKRKQVILPDEYADGSGI